MKIAKIAKIKLLPIALLTFTLFSCNKYPAPIIDNSDIVYKNHSSEKYDRYIAKNYQSPNERYVKIKSGDNLYKIAKENSVNVKDLIDRNRLEPPFILPIGKKIYIPVPNTHIVQSGESLYSISRMYDINISELATNNNLEKPYTIVPGQKLAINSSIAVRKQIQRSNQGYAKKETPVVHTRSVAKAGFSWPVKGRVISAFGPQKKGLYNDGINIEVSKGTEVHSSQEGTVAYVGNELKGYGNLIIIKHPDKMITAYGHLGETKVKRGQKVEKQQIIASVGDTGNVNSPQLYFGLRRGRDAINPQHYLR